MSESVSTTAPIPPLPRDPAIQAALDAEHLKLLEIGFYISGVVTAFRFIWFILIAAIFFCTGLGILFTPHQSNGPSNNPPAFMFLLIAFGFGFLLLIVMIFAALEIYAGRCLKKREHSLFIQIVAAFYCLSIPWGTALGVFTFMVLNRDSVRSLFNKPSP